MMSIEKNVINWCFFFQNNTSKYDTPKPMSFTAIHLGSNTNNLAHMDWRHRHQTQLVRLCSAFDTFRVIAVILSINAPWASYQIRKIAGCACAGNAGNVSPRRQFQRKPLVSDPGMHHGTCVTHVPWCMSGSLTCDDGENVPGIPGACVLAILRIWQEAHGFPWTRSQRLSCEGCAAPTWVKYRVISTKHNPHTY